MSNLARLIIIIFAGFLSASSNGLLSGTPIVAWVVTLVSTERIYLLIFQTIGQYELLVFLYSYFRQVLRRRLT